MGTVYVLFTVFPAIDNKGYATLDTCFDGVFDSPETAQAFVPENLAEGPWRWRMRHVGPNADRRWLTCVPRRERRNGWHAGFVIEEEKVRHPTPPTR